MNIFDFNVLEFDYNLRDGNLINESICEPYSKKDFPYFYLDNEKVIFKPLSKTKPLTTPFFSYSEVIWSTLLNKFFDDSVPIYHLAKCNGIDEFMPNKYNLGVTVKCLSEAHQNIMSLYEYFMLNPENIVSAKIKGYINYCLKFYDYTFFFETEFIKSNPKIGEYLALNILYSILRADQNYHYENVSFLTENKKIKSMIPPIDHEFSTMFLYIDKILVHEKFMNHFLSTLIDEYHGNEIDRLMLESESEEIKNRFTSKNYNNIKKIVSLYPDLVSIFINNLDSMINYLEYNKIEIIDNDYIKSFNSDSYLIGEARYKEHNENKASSLESVIEMKSVDLNNVSKQINDDIIITSKQLKNTLEKRLRML